MLGWRPRLASPAGAPGWRDLVWRDLVWRERRSRERRSREPSVFAPRNCATSSKCAAAHRRSHPRPDCARTGHATGRLWTPPLRWPPRARCHSYSKSDRARASERPGPGCPERKDLSVPSPQSPRTRLRYRAVSSPGSRCGGAGLGVRNATSGATVTPRRLAYTDPPGADTPRTDPPTTRPVRAQPRPQWPASIHTRPRRHRLLHVPAPLAPPVPSVPPAPSYITAHSYMPW